MFDINGWEVIVLAIVAVIVLGPERLPVYAAKLARAVRQLKTLPRQYDPRKIVRDALMDTNPSPAGTAGPSDTRVWAPETPPGGAAYDPGKPTPWDTDAT